MAKTFILVAKEKKRKRKEQGVVYPDGTIEWNPFRFNEDTSKAQIREYQKQMKEDYIVRCQQMGIIPARGLIFVSRTVTTSYSTPKAL